MCRVTIRLPRKLYEQAHASNEVANAGFVVGSDFDGVGLPNDTGWVSFYVDCPRLMGPRDVVSTFAEICG